MPDKLPSQRDYWSQLPGPNAPTDLIQKTLGIMSRPYDILKGTPVDPARGKAIEKMINRQINLGDTVRTMVDQLIDKNMGNVAAQRLALGGWATVGDTVERMGEAMASHLRRNRDRAVHHITDDHVRQTVERMGHDDWVTFLDAQRDGVDNPDDPFTGRLEETLQHADRQDLRDGIVRELLLITWARAAWELQYDGERTQPLEWEDPETGETLQLVATPDDVTTYLIDEYLKDGASWMVFPHEYVERDILEALLQPVIMPPTIPTFMPAIRDGIGDVITNGVANGFRYWGTGDWPMGENGMHPEARYAWGTPGKPLSGEVLYSMDPAMITTAADGWSIVNSLDDADVDTFELIGMKWMANRSNPSPYDGIYIDADEILKSQGFTKHPKGGYRARDRAAIAASIDRLRTITTHSRMLHIPKGKRTSDVVEITAPLIVVSHWIDIRTHNGVQYPTKWYVRPGDWAAAYFDIALQYAPMLERLLQLGSGTDYIPKRIGRLLVERFRFRKRAGNYDKPYVIRTLLENARVPVDRQIGRFRGRVEDALDVLRDDVGMIEAWGYVDDVPTTGRGMRQRWLDARIWITPTTPSIGAPMN